MLHLVERRLIIQTICCLARLDSDRLVQGFQGILKESKSFNQEFDRNSFAAMLDLFKDLPDNEIIKIERSSVDFIASHYGISKRHLSVLTRGRIDHFSSAKLKEFRDVCRVLSRDAFLDLAFCEKGSVRLILYGTEEGLKALENLLVSSDVQSIFVLDENADESRRARFSEALKIRQEFLNHARDIDLSNASKNASSLAHILFKASASALNLYEGLRTRESRVRYLEKPQRLVLELHNPTMEAQDIFDSLILPTIRAKVRDFSDTNVRHNISMFSSLISQDLSSNNPRNLAYRLVQDSRRLSQSLSRVNEICNEIVESLSSTKLKNKQLLQAHKLSLDIQKDLDFACKKARELYSNLIDARENASKQESEIDLNLSNLDLSGMNLEGIYLVGIDLTNTIFKNSMVKDAIFGDNKGLTQGTRSYLGKRGAIFKDTPGLSL